MFWCRRNATQSEVYLSTNWALLRGLHHHSLLGTFGKLRKANIIFVRSACLSEWNNSAPTGWILIKFYMSIFRMFVETVQARRKRNKNNGYFIWRLWTFMRISHWIFLTMRKVSDKSCKENQNTHFMFSTPPPPRKSCLLLDSVENIVEPDRPQMIV